MTRALRRSRAMGERLSHSLPNEAGVRRHGLLCRLIARPAERTGHVLGSRGTGQKVVHQKRARAAQVKGGRFCAGIPIQCHPALLHWIGHGSRVWLDSIEKSSRRTSNGALTTNLKAVAFAGQGEGMNAPHAWLTCRNHDTLRGESLRISIKSSLWHKDCLVMLQSLATEDLNDFPHRHCPYCGEKCDQPIR